MLNMWFKRIPFQNIKPDLEGEPHLLIPTHSLQSIQYILGVRKLVRKKVSMRGFVND
jgi:hypothetical protein